MKQTSLLAERDPSNGLAEQLEAMSPESPFCTRNYSRALQLQGQQPWVIGEVFEGVVRWAALAGLVVGRLNRVLQIPSLNTGSTSAAFWDEFFRFCRSKQVTQLSLQSFCSPHCNLPEWRSEMARRSRREYLLDLDGDDLWKVLSTNHKRNVKKAVKANVTFTNDTSSDACQQHVMLQQTSMDRRAARGESTALGGAIRTAQALVESGAGRIYQARIDDRVVSSVLILCATRGAYYQSAGTNTEGMQSGASHALIHEICRTLKGDGIRRFSLGGVAVEQAGLARFKTGFGARPTGELHSARVSLVGPLRHALGTAISGLKRRLGRA